MKVLECGTLIDGLADDPVSEARIVIDNGEILEVGGHDDVSIPDDAAVHNHTGQTVTPGFIESHVHLNGTREFASVEEEITTDESLRAARGIDDLQALLAAGFTTVRDVASVTGLGLREAIEEDTIVGPRVFTSGVAFSQTAGHVDLHSVPYEWMTSGKSMWGELADGEAECRKKARTRLRQGVDLIKIMTTGGLSSEKDDPEHPHYTAAEVQAFTEEAHRFGVPVACHAEGTAGINLALENGVDTIEHAIGIDERGIEMAEQHDATIVPTLAAIHTMAVEGEAYGIPEHAIEKAKRTADLHIESIRRAYEADLPLALGADFDGSSIHSHGTNALEFELLVEKVGMSEMEVIQAATSVGSRTIPAGSIGSIAPGNHADLVVLDDDPLADISAVRDSIATVYKGGVQV